MHQKGEKSMELLATQALGTHELRRMNDCHDLQKACDCHLSLATSSSKFDGVNMLMNFEFSCDTATVWRASV